MRAFGVPISVLARTQRACARALTPPLPARPVGRTKLNEEAARGAAGGRGGRGEPLAFMGADPALTPFENWKREHGLWCAGAHGPGHALHSHGHGHGHGHGGGPRGRPRPGGSTASGGGFEEERAGDGGGAPHEMTRSLSSSGAAGRRGGGGSDAGGGTPEAFVRLAGLLPASRSGGGRGLPKGSRLASRVSGGSSPAMAGASLRDWAAMLDAGGGGGDGGMHNRMDVGGGGVLPPAMAEQSARSLGARQPLPGLGR